MLGEFQTTQDTRARYNALPRASFSASSADHALFGIDPQDFLELQIIAQQIGGDLALEVSLGIPGQGSFFSFSPPRITLDPMHVLSDPHMAKFVAGHEGAHRRFSVSPSELLSDVSELEAFFGQLGCHSTMNTIEDCAVNDGMCREVPGMGAYTTRTYAAAEEKGMQIQTPEIEAIIQQIGREPKFVQVLTEMTRDWHLWRKEYGYQARFENVAKDGRYQKNLDPSVLKALRNTRHATRRTISSMPKQGEGDAEIVRRFGLERLSLIRDQIYPEIKRLVEEDIDVEAMRQGLQSKMKDSLSKSAKEEIKQAVQQFLQEKVLEQQEKYQKLQQQLQKEQATQKNLKEQLSNDSGSAQSNASANGGEDQEKARAMAASKIREQGLQEQLQEHFSELPQCDGDPSINSDEQIQEKLLQKLKQQLQGEQPLPFEKLSASTQKELQEAFAKLKESEKEKLREGAAQKLAEVEHEIVQALKPKLQEESVETIHEKRIREEQAHANEADFEDQVQQISKLEKQLEREWQSSLEPFDKTFENVAPEVQEATNRLQQVLIPETFFRWQKDQHDGARLNLGRALQSEADPRYLTKLFERRINPTQRTHAFELLIDTSGSMDGKKMEYAFQGIVFLACLCENVGVQFEVIEFNDSSILRKVWSDSIKDEAIRRKITQSGVAKNSGTNDAAALEKAYARLLDKDAKYKFIFVLTDAQSGTADALQKILKKIEKSQTTVVVHFGIGDGTADTNGYYSHSFGNLSPHQFFKKFCEVVEESILSPEKYLSKPSTEEASFVRSTT